MDSSELQQRTKKLALWVLRLVEAIPGRRSWARAIANQLVRAGTAVGANYRASCKARSCGEFIAKKGIVEEEADESAYWMELLIEGAIMPQRLVQPLHDESVELAAIMAASRITAARALRRSSNRQSAIGSRQ